MVALRLLSPHPAGRTSRNRAPRRWTAGCGATSSTERADALALPTGPCFLNVYSVFGAGILSPRRKYCHIAWICLSAYPS